MIILACCWESLRKQEEYTESIGHGLAWDRGVSSRKAFLTPAIVGNQHSWVINGVPGYWPEAELCVRTLEYLNTTNAILSKENAQLVASARSRYQTKKVKQAISKARVLSKEDADRMRTEAGAEPEIGKKVAISRKKKDQELKKVREQTELQKRPNKLINAPWHGKSTLKWVDWRRSNGNACLVDGLRLPIWAIWLFLSRD